jgi:secreted Zn-dependent insulinase-like peptidase
MLHCQGPCELVGWDPSAVADVLAHMTPRKAQLLVVASEHTELAESAPTEWSTEKWYGTQYKQEKISEQVHRHIYVYT